METGKPPASRVETSRARAELLAIAQGYFPSSVLFALTRLGLVELLADGARSAGELAPEVGAQPETLRRLLNAAVAVELLEPEGDGRYRLSPTLELGMMADADGHEIGHWIRHLDYLAGALTGLDRAVLGSRPAVEPDDCFVSDPERTRKSMLAMHSFASAQRANLAHSLDTEGCESLLDLGCGPGTYAYLLGQANPGLRLHLLDRPEVLEVAREVRGAYTLRNEVHYLPLDALESEIPGSYDLILLSNVLHMLGREASRELVGRLYRSTNVGGSVVIHGSFLREDEMGGRWPALLDLSVLCVTPHGRNHSALEAERWLLEAGFRDIDHSSMTLLDTNTFVRGFRRPDASPGGGG